MNYRPEIDGLRAVAVVPVILFHAGFEVMSGGFVGVDVFFVISGYLITTILLTEKTEGRYSILRFYERRARRILPALFAVLLVCLPFAWSWMIPSAFLQFCYSLASTVLFVSNLYFLDSAGYFATGTEHAPLLHTWSLAVEEQYYLLFPLVLLVLGRFSRRWYFVCIGALALASLAFAEWAARAYPDENFFFTLSRLWELFAGSLCAVAVFHRPQQSNQFLGALGLAMIVGAVLFYDAGTPFPSVYALAPVGGTALVILFAARGTIVARLLSLRAFTAIGLISYSAYLWHQPLFAFARVRSIYEPSVWVMIALAVATFPLAWLSWRFVEQPFRHGKTPLLPRRWQVFGASAAMAAALFGFGLMGHATDGAPWRFAESVALYDAQSHDRNPLQGLCRYRVAKNQKQQLPQCTRFLVNGRSDVVFIGDSHSGALSYEAQKLLAAHEIGSYSIFAAGCIGLSNFFRVDANDAPRCHEYNEAMLEFARHKEATTIVIASRFTNYLTGVPYTNDQGVTESGNTGFIDVLSNPPLSGARTSSERKKRVRKAIRAQITALTKEFNVILVYPIPEAGWHVPRTRAKRALFEGDQDRPPLSTSYDRYLERNADILALFNSLDLPGLYHVRPADVFCNARLPGRCENERDGRALYFDDDHPSNSGAGLLAPLIVGQVKAALDWRESASNMPSAPRK